MLPLRSLLSRSRGPVSTSSAHSSSIVASSSIVDILDSDTRSPVPASIALDDVVTTGNSRDHCLSVALMVCGLALLHNMPMPHDKEDTTAMTQIVETAVHVLTTGLSGLTNRSRFGTSTNSIGRTTSATTNISGVDQKNHFVPVSVSLGVLEHHVSSVIHVLSATTSTTGFPALLLYQQLLSLSSSRLVLPILPGFRISLLKSSVVTSQPGPYFAPVFVDYGLVAVPPSLLPVNSKLYPLRRLTATAVAVFPANTKDQASSPPPIPTAVKRGNRSGAMAASSQLRVVVGQAWWMGDVNVESDSGWFECREQDGLVCEWLSLRLTMMTAGSKGLQQLQEGARR
ncbi:hypothetical protein CPB84DRAFT_1844089 [Gymnopilus junonius]|uniref:Uncharacterized protein n=1 Tax=Gymnopilus junonius TaxID=109634 RepID=A0A9P5NWQ8_GYMJU|nr:hypothetical protein CPB84DRAFT_1844089 [Gymnopilus junonius]